MIEVVKQIEQLPPQSVEVLAYRIKSVTKFEQRMGRMTTADMESMNGDIVNTQIFLRTHERFLQELA